jgi:hypothetical protein
VAIAAAVSLLSNAVLYFLPTRKQRGDAQESRYSEAALYTLQPRLCAAKAKAMQQQPLPDGPTGILDHVLVPRARQSGIELSDID